MMEVSALTNDDKKLIADREKAIYDQDCQFYRYQDGKRWGRFQTVAALEGGALYALFGNAVVIGPCEKAVLAILIMCLTFVILRIAVKDAIDSGQHLLRIRRYEIKTEKFEMPEWKGPNGHALMKIAMFIVSFFNIGLVFKFVWLAIYKT